MTRKDWEALAVACGGLVVVAVVGAFVAWLVDRILNQPVP